MRKDGLRIFMKLLERVRVDALDRRLGMSFLLRVKEGGAARITHKGPNPITSVCQYRRRAFTQVVATWRG